MTGRRLPSAVTSALVALCILNACYHSKSPDQVAKDTNTAENTANQATGKAVESAADKITSAQRVVSDEQAAAAHTRAIEVEKVSDTLAQGDHKIALAQCESLSGEPQKACREQADTAFTVAEDKARQARADTDPRP
jgi:hypothetical protein